MAALGHGRRAATAAETGMVDRPFKFQENRQKEERSPSRRMTNEDTAWDAEREAARMVLLFVGALRLTFHLPLVITMQYTV